MAQKIARRASEVEPRTGSPYPPELAAAVEGRAKAALGNLFGLDQFGVNLTSLAPGAASALRHWHAAEDEFIYVLEGTPALVTDAGEEVLEPGDCAGFKASEPNGHCLVNRTGTVVRYLEIGTRRPDIDACDYPDVDMRLEPDGSGARRFVHRDGTPY